MPRRVGWGKSGSAGVRPLSARGSCWCERKHRIIIGVRVLHASYRSVYYCSLKGRRSQRSYLDQSVDGHVNDELMTDRRCRRLHASIKISFAGGTPKEAGGSCGAGPQRAGPLAYPFRRRCAPAGNPGGASSGCGGVSEEERGQSHVGRGVRLLRVQDIRGRQGNLQGGANLAGPTPDWAPIAPRSGQSRH